MNNVTIVVLARYAEVFKGFYDSAQKFLPDYQKILVRDGASVMGAGAVVGGLISAARPRPRARALCLAAIGWGIAILAAAAAPTMALELAALVFVGYGSITFNSLAKTTLQLVAKPEMRGRVM